MASNPEHLEILKKMGVSLIHLKDGRVQLVQHAIQVRSHFALTFFSLTYHKSYKIIFEMLALTSVNDLDNTYSSYYLS